MGANNEVDEISEKLLMLSLKISDKDFKDKPEYFKISTHNLLDDECLSILNKLSGITKYYIVSPIEILYKFKYDVEHKISKEKDKCSICQFELYEEELAIYENNPDNLEYFRDIPFNVILLENCADHFFHIKCIGEMIANKSSFKCPVCCVVCA